MTRCTFKRGDVQCDRDARKGWTTCDRHYSAGRTKKITTRKKAS